MKRLPPDKELPITLGYAAVWVLCWLNWTAWHIGPNWLLLIGFLPTVYFLWLWGGKFTKWVEFRQKLSSAKGFSSKIEVFLDAPKLVPTVPTIPFRLRLSLWALPAWQFLVFVTWFFGARGLSKGLTTFGTIALFFVGLAWSVWWVEMRTRVDTVKTTFLERAAGMPKPRGVLWALTNFRGRLGRKDFWIGILLLLATTLLVTLPFNLLGQYLLHLGKNVPALVCTGIIIAIFAVYLFCLFAVYVKRWHDLGRSGFWVWIQLVPIIGTIYGFVLPAFFTGQAEANRYGESTTKSPWTTISPLNLSAGYYGRDKQKLKQSLLTAFTYGLAFTFTVLFLGSLKGCRELYEMPAGGGEVAQLQQVKVQKVIKKKFVINPFSAILFNPPPIEDVQLQLNEATKHAYTVGYGKGTGAGFSGGTNRGAVRFIRLEYSGGDWDQDFGIGADQNILIEYGVRTRHKTAKKTESRKIGQLKNFPKGKSPPMVYITGQKNIHVSKRDRDILREYLLDKQGMIFADNGGSRHWHGQFFNLMSGVLPDIRPVRVPLDHQIHTIPFQIPFLPYVAPHGGKDAYGWVVDGRLVAYYHPGDIGDAWSDGHAGVSSEISELCYQLGVNVIFYAHAEYNRWLDGQKPDDE